MDPEFSLIIVWESRSRPESPHTQASARSRINDPDHKLIYSNTVIRERNDILMKVFLSKCKNHDCGVMWLIRTIYT